MHHKGDKEFSWAYVVLSERPKIETVFALIDLPGINLLHSLDVSDCVKLDPTSIIDLLGTMHQLKVFVYCNCPQINQFHIQRVVDVTNESLEIIDATGSGDISPTFLIGMLFQLPHCFKFWVTPRKQDTKLWVKLVNQFGRVDFGHEVHMYVPQAREYRNITKILLEM